VADTSFSIIGVFLGVHMSTARNLSIHRVQFFSFFFLSKSSEAGEGKVNQNMGAKEWLIKIREFLVHQPRKGSL
jgi:hypothetical protein